MARSVPLGPFERSSVPDVVVSRFGVIPKGGQVGRWRLIVDLSHPERRSVNDGISTNWCSLKYMRVEDVAERLLQLGLGAQMAKMDVKSAYRIVPVRPADGHILAMQWDDQIFVEAALSFGLRSAPKIFNALADTIEWMARKHRVIDVWHYLDDFIVCGRPGSIPQLWIRITHVAGLVRVVGSPTRRGEGGRPFEVNYLLGNRNGHIG